MSRYCNLQDLQAEAERAAQLCSKKTPVPLQSEVKKLKAGLNIKNMISNMLVQLFSNWKL